MTNTLFFAELEDLLSRLYALDPDDRPSLKQVAKHSWYVSEREFSQWGTLRL